MTWRDFHILIWLETAHPLLFIGLLLVLSYIGGKVANRLHAPRATGYLVIGMLLSPSVSGLFHERLVASDLNLITDIALSIIAFSIGGGLGLPKLKRLGKQILLISLAESMFAFWAVAGGLSLCFLWGEGGALFFSHHLPLALVVGALSAATAPAATLAIVHEYRAEGPLTTILLGVVALDDGLALLFFAFATAVAGGLVHHESITWTSVILVPALTILGSLSIGAMAGGGMKLVSQRVPRGRALFGVMLGMIFMTGGLAASLSLSPILANMMLGFVIANFINRHEDLFTVIEDVEEPVFGMFFALAGAHFDFRVLAHAGLLTVVMTACRFAGKSLGCYCGARVSGAQRSVQKYLGFAILPQAGIAVGLVLIGKQLFGPSEYADMMVNAVLGAVIINELLTPFFVRFALSRAGEISIPVER